MSIFLDSNDCKSGSCSPTDQVVCGTDGITYTNECAVKIVACLFDEKADLRVAFNDSCYSTERINQQVLYILFILQKSILDLSKATLKMNLYHSFIHFHKPHLFLVSMKRVTATLVFKLTMKGKQSSSQLEQSILH